MSLDAPPSPLPHSLPEYREREPDARRWTRLECALLALVLLIAALVRCTGLNRPMSYDELWHLGLSTGRGSPIGQLEADRVYLDPPRQTSLEGAPPFWKCWTGMDGVLHPPLYVITLRLWRDLFGQSDIAAIWYSAAWSLLAIAMVFATVRLFTDAYVTALISLAVALARTQVYFAQAIRGYEMLIGLGAIAMWLMVRIEIFGSTRRRLMVLALATLPILLTHYFSAGAVAAIVLYGLWRGRPYRLAFFLSLVAVGAVYAVVWLPFAIRQLDALWTGDAFLKVERVNLFDETILMFGTPFRLIVDATQTTHLAGVLGAAISGAVIFVLVHRRYPRALVPALCWTVMSIGLIAFLDIARSTRHGLFIRYLAIATPGVFVLFAALVCVLPEKLRLVAASALVVGAIIVRPPGREVLFDAPGFARISEWLAKETPPDEAILLFRGNARAGYPDDVFIHCSHEPGLFPRPLVKVESPLTREIVRQLPRRAWLVVPVTDPESLGRTFPGVRVLTSMQIPGEGVIWHIEMPSLTTQESSPTTQPSPATRVALHEATP